MGAKKQGALFGVLFFTAFLTNHAIFSATQEEINKLTQALNSGTISVVKQLVPGKIRANDGLLEGRSSLQVAQDNLKRQTNKNSIVARRLVLIIDYLKSLPQQSRPVSKAIVVPQAVNKKTIVASRLPVVQSKTVSRNPVAIVARKVIHPGPAKVTVVRPLTQSRVNSQSASSATQEQWNNFLEALNGGKIAVVKQLIPSKISVYETKFGGKSPLQLTQERVDIEHKKCASGTCTLLGRRQDEILRYLKTLSAQKK